MLLTSTIVILRLWNFYVPTLPPLPSLPKCGEKFRSCRISKNFKPSKISQISDLTCMESNCSKSSEANESNSHPWRRSPLPVILAEIAATLFLLFIFPQFPVPRFPLPSNFPEWSFHRILFHLFVPRILLRYYRGRSAFTDVSLNAHRDRTFSMSVGKGSFWVTFAIIGRDIGFPRTMILTMSPAVFTRRCLTTRINKVYFSGKNRAAIYFNRIEGRMGNQILWELRLTGKKQDEYLSFERKVILYFV